VFKIPHLYGTPFRVGKTIGKCLKSKFDRFFLDRINEKRIGIDGLDHNKLRLYNKLKGSFTPEPYLMNIRNRNQRMWLSRFRTSAHKLRVETGRYTNPKTPLEQRLCVYCDTGECDTELHAIIFCKTFKLKRQCFFGRVAALCPDFMALSPEQKLITLLCPASTQLGKCVSKFLGIITTIRKEIDLGLQPALLQQYIKHKN